MADLINTDRTIRALQRQSLFVISADRGWAQRFQLAAQDVPQKVLCFGGFHGR